MTAEDLFSGARERSGGNPVWIALDSLTDPHNVGAIFRIAGFFGIEGILLTSERSAPLTSTVYDVSCGGIETVPHSEAVNLQRAFEVAKREGLWILGTSEHSKGSYLEIARDRPWLVVIGNEEKGMRRLTAESCDVLTGIPPLGDVTSLNASVAQWLVRTGRATAPYVASQGGALGRAGRIHISADPDGQIWVGGGTITCVRGEVEL